MRVALLMRADADARPGGDVVQARAVARYLRDRGADVQELQGWAPDLRGARAAIVMNLTVPEQAWLHASVCRRADIPYVLFPVFWDLAAAIPQEQRPTASWALPMGSRRRGVAQRSRLLMRDRSALRTAATRLPHYLSATSRQLVVETVAGARAVLPNSLAELDHLAGYTGLAPAATWQVVRNGLWVDELPPVQESVSAHREDVVLSVGAISPRKNTLGLVRAAKELPWRFEVVGKPPHPSDAYARRVLAEAPPNVHFVGLLARAEVLRRMGGSRVHVQPGFVETPGLASLEALAMATPVVVSDTAPVREYFGRDAVYSDPNNAPSIAQAIRAAFEMGPQSDAAARVRLDFDWSHALHGLTEFFEV